MSDDREPSELVTTGAESNAVPLILTKTQLPRRRRDLLPRQRLVSFVHAHLDRKLILISAPAGWGKTSLLTDFAHDTDLPVCWYTLDPFDRDLRVFLEYLIAAIARRFPAFGSRSLAFLEGIADPGRNLYPIVATLVQEIHDAIPEYFVLVLDDHHTVEHQEQINEFLDLFLTYVDENCHVILASRTLPALPNLSLLVARRQAAGLSVDELRFTAREVQALAEQNYGLKLSPDQAEVLARRTDGWITGLLLMAVPHWEQARSEVHVPGQITVDLYDYLSRQVLDQQPEQLRNFLLASSVLDELSPELCTAILGIDGCGTLIEQVRMRNLFVIDFEGDVNRIRYHDLFHDFLQSCLRREDEARFRDLTRRAAQTYASQGEWERAVSRYLTLQEFEPVAEIVERMGTQLFDAGRWDTLASWIDALPAEIQAARPDLLVQRGTVHAERGEHTPALALFERAEQAYDAEGSGARAAHVLARKSAILRFQGRYDEAIAHCQQALARISGVTAEDTAAMAMAHKNMGLCELRLGRLAKGRQALHRALRLYEELDARYDMAMVHHDLGLGYELAGNLAGAVDHYRAALGCWEQLGNLSPWANTLNGLGVVYHLRGEYDQALPILNKALSKAQQARDLRIEAFALASLGDLHRDLGAYGRAEGAYTQALEIARRAHLGFIITYALDGLGNTHRLQRDLPQARKRLLQAMEHAQDHASAYETGFCHTSLGILATEEDNLAAAPDHLSRAVEILETSGFQQQLCRAYLYRAQTALTGGEPSVALADVERALALATQLGYDQFLVVDGQQLGPLLRYAAGQGVGNDFLPDLLERIERHRLQLAGQPEPVIPAESPPALKICALGQPEVKVDDQSVQWAVAKSRDLFFFLLQHSQGLQKEQIGAEFWPDHEPERLDSVFRSTLYRLRRVVFRDSVVFEDGLYQFNYAGDYWFDVEAFEGLLNQAEQSSLPDSAMALLEEALGLYQGDYLEGVYADWCALERERLRARYLAALETLAGLYAEQRKLQRAIEAYQHLVAEDRYQEVAHRGLMRCYFRQGDRAAAIRQYQALVEILQEELGLSPSPETEQLYLQIIG